MWREHPLVMLALAIGVVINSMLTYYVDGAQLYKAAIEMYDLSQQCFFAQSSCSKATKRCNEDMLVVMAW